MVLTNRLATTPARPALTQGRTARKGSSMEEQENRENLDAANAPNSEDAAVSIQAQMNACRQYFKDQGIEVVAEYIDRS